MAKIWVLPTIRGLAYLASANFAARIILLLDKLTNSFFSYEMVLLYSAHLDTHILLFFQAVFMLPVALLGVLVFYGIEKQSFNLVLYPTLMLLFLILLRYGSESALLIIHWEEHCLDRGPSLIFYGVLDLVAIIILLLYVYMSLAAPPLPNSITPSRLNSLRRKLQRLSSRADVRDMDLETGRSNDVPKIVGVTRKQKKPPAPPPNGEVNLLDSDPLDLEESKPGTPPPRPPPSPKFNYKLRRNVAHLEQREETKAAEKSQDLDKPNPRNSDVIQEDKEGEESAERAERDSPTPTFTLKLKSQSLKTYETEPKRRSLLIETDLDEKLHNEPKVSPTPSREKDEDVDVVEKVDVETAETLQENTHPDPDPDDVELEITPAEEYTKPKTVVEDEDESEWEYEVEEPQKTTEAVIENLTQEKPAEEDLQDDSNNMYQPETTTSSTGYKTTAV